MLPSSQAQTSEDPSVSFTPQSINDSSQGKFENNVLKAGRTPVKLCPVQISLKVKERCRNIILAQEMRPNTSGEGASKKEVTVGFLTGTTESTEVICSNPPT